MVFDVGDQRVDRRITLGQDLLQGLVQHRVEVAPQLFADGLVGAGHARQRRVDRGDGLFERGGTLALERVRAGAGQQPVHHDAQAVDIAGRAERLAANRLRARVVGRHGTPALLRELRLLCQLAFHQLGDAEVEQAHLALCGDENVGGLEVAVHHQPRVGMRHRACDLQHQPQALRHRQRTAFAIGIDSFAFDVFERKVRAAMFIDTSVVKARDVRVAQARQNVVLAAHALGQAARPAQARQLQRHRALQAAVDPLGQPHQPHAPDTELADQPVRADLRAGRDRIFLQADACRGRRECQFGQRAEEVVGLDARGVGQQATQLGLDRIGFGQRIQPCVALPRFDRQGLVQPAADGGPFIGKKPEIGHGTSPSTADDSRACSITRITLRSGHRTEPDSAALSARRC